MDTKATINITAQTILMKAPLLMPDKSILRQAKTTDKALENLILFEDFLRRSAYKNTSIKTDEGFYNDSDMTSDYHLVVVFDKTSNTPLLSARHYSNTTVIARYLKGDVNTDLQQSISDNSFQLMNYPEGKLILADRLSGNVHTKMYRQYRSQIFASYYAEIANNHKNCTLLLMVRKAKGNKQLQRYLKLGFSIIGSTLHKGKEHSIILRNL